MTNLTVEQRIKKAIQEADLLFWATIADQFPEITSGDFPPDAHFKFGRAQEDAVKLWIKYNFPKDKIESLLEEPHNTIVRNIHAYIEERGIEDDFDKEDLDKVFFDENNIPRTIDIDTLEDEGIDLIDFNIYLETMGKIV